MGLSRVVTYQVDDETTVGFEIEPVEGFVPAGIDDIAGQVRKAAEPAVAAARAVLERVRALSPDGVEVTFGIKVTGTANWLIAKAATEGNFEVKLSWRPGQHPTDAEDVSAGRDR
jgi:Trypsin-co-occurring domain 1